MEPLDKGLFHRGAGKWATDGGRCPLEQSATEKVDVKDVERNKYFLDEGREYHVILWGATGFAGRFAAEYLAHYYMKHEEHSLYPFKSAAFSPACPLSEGAAGSHMTSADKPMPKSAPASGFLPSGLTPGEHEPDVTPPIRGTAVASADRFDFGKLLGGPRPFSHAERVLAAESTSVASEHKPPRGLTCRSGPSVVGKGRTSALGRGTPPRATAATDALGRANSGGARDCSPLYGTKKPSTLFTSSHLQCGSDSDSGSPTDDYHNAEISTQKTCGAMPFRRGARHARDGRATPSYSFRAVGATEGRRTASERNQKEHRREEKGGEVHREKAMAEQRKHRDRHDSTSSVFRKRTANGKTKQQPADGGGQGDDEWRSENEDSMSETSRQEEEPRSEAERSDEKETASEHEAQEEFAGNTGGSRRSKDYYSAATPQRTDGDAANGKGNVAEDKEGNSVAEHNASEVARRRRKAVQPHAPQTGEKTETNDEQPFFQRLKLCHCLSCDWARTPPSSSSVSAGCLGAASLNAASAREKINFALAGRSIAKLRHLRYQLAERLGRHCMRIDLIAVNPADEEALERLCSRARVVLSTCGPYRLCGEAVIKACIAARTHYCDITAEVSYVADMAAKYSAAAAKRKLKLVFFCGAGSLPSDLTVLMTQREALRIRGIPCHEIRTAVTDCFGGFSGGSVMGLGRIFEEGAVFDPFFLVKYASPNPPSKEELLPYMRPQIFLAKHDEDFGYCAYNVLAPLNENVVRFSSVLLGLYTRPDLQIGSPSPALKASGTGGKGRVRRAEAVKRGKKSGQASYFDYSSPCRSISPLFSLSSGASPCSHGTSSSNTAFSSSSKCSSSTTYIVSSASNSPSFQESPSLSCTFCQRRRGRSRAPSPPSPSSEKSAYFSPVVLPSATWDYPGASPLLRKPMHPEDRPTATPCLTRIAATPATVAPPPSAVADPDAAPASAQRRACLHAAPVVDTSSTLWRDSSFFRYSECVALGYDVLTASVVSFITFVLMFLVTSSFCRAALTALHIFPRPGEGPPRQFLDKGHFQIKTVGRVFPTDENRMAVHCVPTDDEEEAENERERRYYGLPQCHVRETVITVTMGSASGDPGYKETGKMLVETGLAIALHRNDCFELCGVCTPASGVGLVLVDRLRKAGMKFEVKVKQF